MHQLLVYVGDVNLLGGNIDAIKKNTETLTDASKEVGLKVITEKTEYILLPCYQNVGKNNNLKIGRKLFENVVQLRYLVTTVTNRKFN
jgi:hypothetical protein